MEKAAYKTTYDNEKAYWWFQARADIVEHVFRKHIPANHLEILNIGCGTGLISQLFSQFGCLAGVDYSSEALNFCAQNSLSSLAQANGIALPFKDNSFDACLSLDVLEHIQDDTQALKEIRRVLKPGGVLLLTVPAFQWMWSNMDEGGHFRRYTKAQVAALLEKVKLKMEIISYYNFFLFPLAVAQRFAERHMRKKAGAGEFLPSLPAGINRLFYLIFRWEKDWFDHLSFPFGLSVLAVAKKI